MDKFDTTNGQIEWVPTYGRPCDLDDRMYMQGNRNQYR